MNRKVIIGILSLISSMQMSVMAATEDQLTQLDKQRDETLNRIKENLIDGRISPAVARQLKTQLDDVVKLESHAKADDRLTDTEVYDISKCLEKVRTYVDSQTHNTKVWMGIDAHDKSIQQKIVDALTRGNITKDQAETFEREFEKLRSREMNGYSTSNMEFTDAISIADDLQTLNGKIDRLIAEKSSVH